MTPQKISHARFLLGWTREQLARASGVPAVEIAKYEAGEIIGAPRLAAVRDCLAAQGIKFLGQGCALYPATQTAGITPDQCRAARNLLGWPQRRLADACGIGPQVIRTYEVYGRVQQPRRHALEDERLNTIQAALEAAGVVFTNGDSPGVKLRKSEG